MNAEMSETLKSEDPVVANLIVDQFEDHLKGKVNQYALQVCINIAIHHYKLGTPLPYEGVQPHNYTSTDSKVVLK